MEGITQNSLNAFMGKLKDSVVKKNFVGTVLLTVIQQAVFTKDNYTNYDYLEVIWRPHSTLGQCSDRMIPSKDSKMHLERAQVINRLLRIYRCQWWKKCITFCGRTRSY